MHASAAPGMKGRVRQGRHARSSRWSRLTPEERSRLIEGLLHVMLNMSLHSLTCTLVRLEAKTGKARQIFRLIDTYTAQTQLAPIHMSASWTPSCTVSCKAQLSPCRDDRLRRYRLQAVRCDPYQSDVTIGTQQFLTCTMSSIKTL